MSTAFRSPKVLNYYQTTLPPSFTGVIYHVRAEGECYPTDMQQSQSTDTRWWWRKVQHLLQDAKQGEQAAHVQKTQTLW